MSIDLGTKCRVSKALTAKHPLILYVSLIMRVLGELQEINQENFLKKEHLSLFKTPYR